MAFSTARKREMLSTSVNPSCLRKQVYGIFPGKAITNSESKKVNPVGVIPVPMEAPFQPILSSHQYSPPSQSSRPPSPATGPGGNGTRSATWPPESSPSSLHSWLVDTEQWQSQGHGSGVPLLPLTHAGPFGPGPSSIRASPPLTGCMTSACPFMAKMIVMLIVLITTDQWPVSVDQSVLNIQRAWFHLSLTTAL